MREDSEYVAQQLERFAPCEQSSAMLIKGAETIRRLRAENEALRAEVERWYAEVAAFNRGWERRAEPYENLEDEFEQMGYCWANFDKLRAENKAMLAIGPSDANPKLAYSTSGDIDRCASVCLLNARAAENAHVGLTQMRLAATLLTLVKERDAARAENDALETSQAELFQKLTERHASHAKAMMKLADTERERREMASALDAFNALAAWLDADTNREATLGRNHPSGWCCELGSQRGGYLSIVDAATTLAEAVRLALEKAK